MSLPLLSLIHLLFYACSLPFTSKWEAILCFAFFCFSPSLFVMFTWSYTDSEVSTQEGAQTSQSTSGRQYGLLSAVCWTQTTPLLSPSTSRCCWLTEPTTCSHNNILTDKEVLDQISANSTSIITIKAVTKHIFNRCNVLNAIIRSWIHM